MSTVRGGRGTVNPTVGTGRFPGRHLQEDRKPRNVDEGVDGHGVVKEEAGGPCWGIKGHGSF